MERHERGTKDWGLEHPNTKEKSTKKTEKELPAQQGEKNNKKRRWFPENKVKNMFPWGGSNQQCQLLLINQV